MLLTRHAVRVTLIYRSLGEVQGRLVKGTIGCVRQRSYIQWECRGSDVDKHISKKTAINPRTQSQLDFNFGLHSITFIFIASVPSRIKQSLFFSYSSLSELHPRHGYVFPFVFETSCCVETSSLLSR